MQNIVDMIQNYKNILSLYRQGKVNKNTMLEARKVMLRAIYETRNISKKV